MMTITLDKLTREGNNYLFDFDFPFYDEELKQEFIDKFCLHFKYREIGVVPLQRFKDRVKAILTTNYPKYRQLYETELRSKNVDFMLNKDLKETFIRNLEGNVLSQNKSNGENKIDSKDNSIGNNIHKESSLNNGLATLGESENYLTGITSDSSNQDSTSTSTNVDKSNSENNTKEDTRETTELLSQGNIGITSSADLLNSWRSCLINLDNIIFEDMQKLFLQVF